MQFHEVLSNYLSSIPCTARELSEESHISTAALSRYRNGERIPQEDSEQLQLLIHGIVALAQKKGLPVSEL